jgi:hypothetical protein
MTRVILFYLKYIVFFLTNHLEILDLSNEFAKWYYESKNAINSPAIHYKPSKSWCSALTRFVMYSGKYVLKKRTRSAPKKY